MEWITGADSNEVDIGEVFGDVVYVMNTSSWTLLDDVMVTSSWTLLEV